MTGQSESETEVVDVNGFDAFDGKTKKRSVHQFVCSFDECKAVFSRLYRLERHIRQHTGERPFVCNINGCLRSFTCKSYLKKHQTRPHLDQSVDHSAVKEIRPRKEYICNECDPKKSFKSKFQLRLHNYLHSGQKPFRCDKCDKQFVTKTKLKSHFKTHDGYSCGREGCDYKACKWSELRKHIATEHKCFRCEVCAKSFANSYNLEVHKETIHLNPNEKIVCTYDDCHKTYSRKSNLMTHIRAEHEKHWFKCTEEGCDLSFVHKKSLNKHLCDHSNAKPSKPKNKKLCPRKVSKASELTGIELNKCEIKELMETDIQFREEVIKG